MVEYTHDDVVRLICALSEADAEIVELVGDDQGKMSILLKEELGRWDGVASKPDEPSEEDQEQQEQMDEDRKAELQKRVWDLCCAVNMEVELELGSCGLWKADPGRLESMAESAGLEIRLV